MTNTTETPPRFADRDASIREWEREYRAEISDLAAVYAALTLDPDDRDDDDRALIEEHGADPDADPEDWLHETLDGHEWVIYTYKAQAVALCSDADGAEEARDMGLDCPTDEQRAYLCMAADVREEAM